MIKVQGKVGTNLINVPKFAKKKGVSVPAVWGAIKKERIDVVLVGEDEHVFIDWPNYKDFFFNDNKKNR